MALSEEFSAFKANFDAGVLAFTNGNLGTALAYFRKCSGGDRYGLTTAVARFYTYAEEQELQT